MLTPSPGSRACTVPLYTKFRTCLSMLTLSPGLNWCHHSVDFKFCADNNSLRAILQSINKHTHTYAHAHIRTHACAHITPGHVVSPSNDRVRQSLSRGGCISTEVLPPNELLLIWVTMAAALWACIDQQCSPVNALQLEKVEQLRHHLVPEGREGGREGGREMGRRECKNR